MTVIARMQRFGRRHRLGVAVTGALACALLLVLGLAGRRDALATALADAPWWTLTLAAVLQVVALLARTEAWHVTVESAGGEVARRVLFRASSAQVFGSLLNGQLGAAARIFALRRSPSVACPQVPTLIAAEVPILAVEAALGALTSFTLVEPLGLPWWTPIIAVGAIAVLGTGLRRLALCQGRKLWRGLAVIRSTRRGARVIAWVMVAVLSQILRNWLLLHAVGVDASFFDAIAVLIAVVTLGQLPVGPAVGAAAAVLILGHHGVPATAAAGLLLTATGTLGALGFAAWAGLDGLWAHARANPLG